MPGKGAKETPALLLLLADNEVMQRLIASWPNTHAEQSSKGAQVEVAKTNDALVSAWAEAAHCRPEELRRCWRSLFTHGFVSPDGSSDPVALQFIATMTLARTPRVAPPKKK